MMKIKLFTTLMMGLALGACISTHNQFIHTDIQSSSAPVRSLENTGWEFTKIIHAHDKRLHHLNPRARIGFLVKNGRIGIDIGCNSVGISGLKFDEQNQKIEPTDETEVVSTLVNCGTVSDAENALSNFFSKGNHYEFKADFLIISDKAGQIIQFKQIK